MNGSAPLEIEDLNPPSQTLKEGEKREESLHVAISNDIENNQKDENNLMNQFTV